MVKGEKDSWRMKGESYGGARFWALVVEKQRIKLSFHEAMEFILEITPPWHGAVTYCFEQYSNQ